MTILTNNTGHRRVPRASWARLALALASCLCCVAAHAQQDPADPPVQAASGTPPAPKPEIVEIALQGAATFGGDVNMVTDVFKPAGPGPFPVLLFSHGRAGNAVDRSKLTRPIPSDQVSFWLGKGYAVVAPIRVGYGATGGPDAEANGVRFDTEGRCVGRPDFRGTAEAAGKTVVATLAWLRSQPWADTQRVILEGQSVGGFATVAAAAHKPDGVLAFINFAGGTGGNPGRSPGHGCDPDQLTDLYTEFGKTTSIPNIWIYAENDQYWGADAPKAWHAGFAKGGSKTLFVQAPPVSDGDGHGLSRHAPRLWAPYLNGFLDSIGK